MKLKTKQSRQVDKKTSVQVRIDKGLRDLLKRKAVNEKTSMKTLLEGCLADLLSVEGSKKNG